MATKITGGKGGQVLKTGTAVGNVRDWAIAYTADQKAGSCTGAAGGTFRVAANSKWSGSYTAYGHTPAVMPGDAFTFMGVMNGATGSGKGMSGAAKCTQVAITWDQEGGNPVSYVVSFVSDGALTTSDALTFTADATVPGDFASKGCLVKLGTPIASPVYTELADVRSVTLTLSVPASAGSSTSTAGVEHNVTGNLDWTVSISCYTDSLVGMPAPNDINAVQIFVEPTAGTKYWALLWGMCSGISDVKVDVETGAIIGCTVGFGMNGFVGITGTWTKGSITPPSPASALW